MTVSCLNNFAFKEKSRSNGYRLLPADSQDESRLVNLSVVNCSTDRSERKRGKRKMALDAFNRFKSSVQSAAFSAAANINTALPGNPVTRYFSFTFFFVLLSLN